MPLRLLEYTSPTDWPGIHSWLSRRDAGEDNVEPLVADILAQVRSRGDEAVAEYTRRFDCPDMTAEALRVPEQDIARALEQIPPADADIIREAAANIRDFHLRQKQNSWITTPAPGTTLGQLVLPVDRAGLYVPGGQGGETPLISSLLMNAIPAQVAGVKTICVVSPPRKDGSLNPYILATAAILGLSHVFMCGSAWAIAALAYGTESIPRVDVIAGPGNIFVTTAKRLLVGQVGIDMIAGPSEIAILADASANPKWLAADMLSQAEHDPLASSILVSAHSDLLAAVQSELVTQLASLPRHEIAARALAEWSALIHVPDLDVGMDLINRLAPEHFELSVSDPWALIGSVRNAGAVFMGHSTPEPVGDYFAGPNHVLPTLSTARFSSALSVDTFCKKTSLICTDQAFLNAHGSKVARLARLEGLEAHARSVEQRLEKS
ncbi:MAG: histidinol dehydrogenase [Desulfomicrobium sp.]|nr:histidinol dehydrogenase [Desulfomicrobium sp.]